MKRYAEFLTERYLTIDEVKAAAQRHLSSSGLAYRGYLIRSNPLNGMIWIEKDGQKIGTANSLDDAMAQVNMLTEAKAPLPAGVASCKKGEDFFMDGNWDVVFTNGKKTRVFYDKSVGIWYEDKPTKQKWTGNYSDIFSTMNKEDLLSQLAKFYGAA